MINKQYWAYKITILYEELDRMEASIRHYKLVISDMLNDIEDEK